MGPTAAGSTTGPAGVAPAEFECGRDTARSSRPDGRRVTGRPPHREAHHRVNWLRDVILGGQDGLVNMIGIVLGDRRRRSTSS